MNEVANTDFTRQTQVQTPRTSQTEMMMARQAQEVQVAMLAAKRFPRDQVAAYNRVITACERKGLAEKALYEFPRGGEKVTGISIRMAESIAQNWGNIEASYIELERKNGESQVMAYAWDLETNTRFTITFTVPHIRHTKKGDYPLTDPRDIYEAVASQAARRVRKCIISVIPYDVQEDVKKACEKTMREGNEEPMIDRVRKMSMVFEKEFSVTLPMLEKYLGCKSEAFSENDFASLRKVYVSLRDGMAKREDYFEIALPSGEGEIHDPFKNEESKEKSAKEVKADGAESK